MEDPCEWNDLRIENREIVAMLTKRLKQYNDSQTFPLYRVYPENATIANPARLGGFWGPWKNVDIDESQSAMTLELPKMGPKDRIGKRHQKGFNGHHRNRDKDQSENVDAVAMEVDTTSKTKWFIPAMFIGVVLV